jgi:hypothetical protein
MEQNKLRIKIGEHEFEAEGPPEIVQAQLAAFKELMASPGVHASVPEAVADPKLANRTAGNSPLALEKIIRIEGRVASLTAHANSLEDALLLLLLGQKTFRSNESVTGAELVDGLRRSGQSTDHMGRTLDKLRAEGNIIVTGAHRGKRYRMTNQGVTKAQEVARSVIGLVA